VSRGKIALVLLVVIGLIAAAWAITGPAPQDADDGFPKQPPPLVLPSDVTPTSAVGRAGAELAVGDLKGARERFVDIVAEAPDDEVAQVGLALSGWRTIGPVSVERDLTQLDREYPESALIAAHLGIVRVELGDRRGGRQALRDAMARGRAADDATGLRMARLADDLVHPGTFRGYVPVLVRPKEVPVPDRAQVRALLSAIAQDDRMGAAKLAAALGGGASVDPMVRVAAAVATFDKDEPQVTVDRLDALVADPTLSDVASDRAEMHAALAQIWAGDAREAACTRLARSSRLGVDVATRSLATPIHRELCDSPHSG